METLLLSYADNKYQAIKSAAKLLRAGELVAIPTETVYGLGADATNSQAVKKIFEAKGRPSDNPLIVHLASKTQLKDYVLPYASYVDKLIEAFSPGPITYVLKCRDILTKEVTAGLDTVGIRFPEHPVAQLLLKQANLPIAAPSANLSGKPSPTSATHVMEDLSGKIAAILDGGICHIGVESTVIDCTGPYPVILRQGKITHQDIEKYIMTKSNRGNAMRSPKSPGVKYKHYAPEVPLILVKDNKQLTALTKKTQAKGERVGVLTHKQMSKDIKADKIYTLGDSKEMYARELYKTLRSMKKADVDVVIAAYVSEHSMGGAVMDRLKRAANKIYD